MDGADAFTVEGVIVQARPNRTYEVQLPNGHRLTGFVAGRAKLSFTGRPGDKVTLKLSSYDLSEGRILVSGLAKMPPMN